MVRLVEDVGAPAVVAAVDIITEEQKPTWNQPAGIALAAVGYGMNVMGVGGDFVKNIGVASAPWAIESIYQYARSGGGASRQVSQARMRPAARLSSGKRVSRGPSPSFEREFQGASLI